MKNKVPLILNELESKKITKVKTQNRKSSISKTSEHKIRIMCCFYKTYYK